MALTIDGRACSCSAYYPTPAASDYHGYKCGEGHIKRKSLRQMRLNHFLYLTGEEDKAHSPEFREQLMGWPTKWTDLEPLAMGKIREWSQQHGDY